MATQAVSILHEGSYSTEVAQDTARRLRAELPGGGSLAVLFVSSDHLPHLEEFVDIIRVDGHVREVVGSTASGVIHGATEFEETSGFSLLAIHSDEDAISIHELSTEIVEGSGSPDFWKASLPAAGSWLALCNPYGFAVDDWLLDWNRAFPNIPTVGGLASGGREAETLAVFHNGRAIDGAVLVGFTGKLQILPAVSQGCRPIGEPLPVTGADENVIFSLGSRPAYQALETAFQSLSEVEKSHAQGNLFAGLAGNEYVDEFRPGDFVIRNIIGADPNSGAVVIAGIPRLGQTMQYQLRDREAADADLQRVLKSVQARARKAVGMLLFCCSGRGEAFFEEGSHDARMVSEVLGRHETAGFFCNGEIGPVAGRNCVHGYTLACAVLIEREE